MAKFAFKQTLPHLRGRVKFPTGGKSELVSQAHRAREPRKRLIRCKPEPTVRVRTREGEQH